MFRVLSQPKAMILGLCATGLLAASAMAAAPAMTAEEFDHYATGKTLTYAQDGVIFGTEQYLPGRRVRWAFTGDQCQIGHWYPMGELICFEYEAGDAPQCWKFWKGETGLMAQFEGDPAGTALSEVRQTDGPLSCTGPDVGV